MELHNSILPWLLSQWFNSNFLETVASTWLYHDLRHPQLYTMYDRVEGAMFFYSIFIGNFFFINNRRANFLVSTF